MRKFTRAIIFMVSVLTTYLLTGLLEEKMLSQTEAFRPITATLLGMVIIVMVFVPVFAYTERITEAVIKAGLQQTKSGAGKILGVAIFTVIIFVILFAIYLNRWFDKSILEVFNAALSK
ncbi:MAG: hypothetical protein HQ472_10940 [Ignavibacteria bacterium]|nr:hypothetical protein [Ignavibacteria bacterium]